MSCYRLETSYQNYKRDFEGMDDLQALAKCLLEVDLMLMAHVEHSEVWVGEFPFEPALWSVFFGNAIPELRTKFNLDG